MALQLQHFDTKLKQDLDVREKINYSLAEYFFPDTEFAIGMVYKDVATATDLERYKGKTLQFASGERMYFASQPVRDLLYPNPSDGAAYGSLAFTPNQQFFEKKDLRILVIDDATGNSGGILPLNISKKLVGDCHGKLSRELAQELTGRNNTPFQFRLGLKPQIGNDVHRIAKGTLAPANLESLGHPVTKKLPNGETQTRVGFDLVLATSSFKGRKSETAIQPGEYNLTLGIGIKALAKYSEHSLGTQVLVNYPRGVETDVLPELKDKAEKLMIVQSEPQQLAQLYVENYERRQRFIESYPEIEPEIESDLEGLGAAIDEALGNEDLEESPQQKQQDLLLYRLLKADLTEHFQVLEHPKIIDTQLVAGFAPWVNSSGSL